MFFQNFFGPNNKSTVSYEQKSFSLLRGFSVLEQIVLNVLFMAFFVLLRIYTLYMLAVIFYLTQQQVTQQL